MDPRTKKRIPTCHRTQFKSILEDTDYKSTLKYADSAAAAVYREEAEYIDKVQKDILAISASEEPFDIFICYKETDENGNRTKDSVIAQDIYTELTEKGYRVFFSRITLEDKLGTAYEPYIFAALNSSKIMLAIGTTPAYYDAVWVKNEWSRYLSLIENGQKKTLIPCYRDMSAYEMPVEFAALQALDVSRLGYMQDLLRGIDKIIGSAKRGSKKADTSDPEFSSTVISRVVSKVAKSDSDNWPTGNIVSTFDSGSCSYIAFLTYFSEAFTTEGEVATDFNIIDEMGNVIYHSDKSLYMKPGYDSYSKVWVLRDQNGPTVADGIYTARISVNNSRPFEHKFKVVSNKAPVKEPEKKKAPVTRISSTIIDRIMSVPADSASDFWPRGSYRTTFNPLYMQYVSFHALLTRPIGFTGNVKLDFKVTDELGNVLCNTTDMVYATHDNDKFAKIWILSDGETRVSDGVYTATISVDNSVPLDYKFVVDSNDMSGYVPPKPKSNSGYYTPTPTVKSKSLYLYIFLAFFFGYLGIHSFYAGKKGKGVAQLILFFTGISLLWAWYDIYRAWTDGEVPD